MNVPQWHRVFSFTLPDLRMNVQAPDATRLKMPPCYIVDDDASVRDALSWLLRSRRPVQRGLSTAPRPSTTMLQSHPDLRRARPCCLLLDVRMPGISGLALFDKLIVPAGCTRRPCR